jgi:hypothetical protein
MKIWSILQISICKNCIVYCESKKKSNPKTLSLNLFNLNFYITNQGHGWSYSCVLGYWFWLSFQRFVHKIWELFRLYGIYGFSHFYNLQYLNISVWSIDKKQLMKFEMESLAVECWIFFGWQFFFVFLLSIHIQRDSNLYRCVEIWK